jgi:hypothetical protein
MNTNYPTVLKLLEQNKMLEAFNECVELLKITPTDEILFRHGVNIGTEAGLIDEVEKFIDDFCTANPNSFEGQFSKGTFCFLKGDITLAKSVFEKMHLVDPQNIAVAVYLATANFTLDPKDSSVIEFIRPYLEKNPDSVLLLYYFAIFLAEFKHNDELETVLDRLKPLDEKLYAALKEQIDSTNTIG